GGELPIDPAILKKLPGIGRYIANAVATFAFDQPVPIVETNIARTMARLFDIRVPIDSAAGRAQLWSAAASLVPKRNAGRLNSGLMDLGALVCRKQPQCHSCPVHQFCQSTNPESLPIKRPRPKLKRLTESHRFSIKGD